MVEVHKPHYSGYAQSDQAGDCALLELHGPSLLSISSQQM